MDEASHLERERTLRLLAEKIMRRQPKGSKSLAPKDLDYLLQELSVHQTELELQNEELLKAQQSLTESQRKYSYLYQFAPVGYFTLNEKNLVVDANVTGCRQLGVQRLFLREKPFLVFVEKAYRNSFRGFWQAVFQSSREIQRRELRLMRETNQPFWAELTGKKFVDDEGQTFCLMVVTDISLRKTAEAALLKLHGELETLMEVRTAELTEARTSASSEKALMQKRLMAAQKQAEGTDSKVSNARKNERQVMARRIHDNLGQLLIAMKMDLGWIRKRYCDDLKIMEKIKDIDRTLDLSIQSMQELVHELRPVVLDRLGLVSAVNRYVEEFQRRTGIKCELAFHAGIAGVKGGRADLLYSTLQEALTNVARHAEADKVRITFRKNAGSVVLTVSDNGRGIEGARIDDPESFGIIGMKERVLSCGGQLEINGKKGRGTIVKAAIPLKDGRE